MSDPKGRSRLGYILSTVRTRGTTYNYDVVIIGAGPAGMCAGLYAGRSMLKAVILEKGFPGGELLNTELIEDYPGFDHILGHDLAQKFADHAAKFGAEIRERACTSIASNDAPTGHSRRARIRATSTTRRP